MAVAHIGNKAAILVR